MSDKNEIIIKDACVLFDLIDLGILAHFYKLSITVYTTSIVISEVTDPDQFEEINHYINTGQLVVDKSTSVDEITAIITVNPGLSFADGSVLELATRIRGTVLSSDKSLRNEAARRKLQVKGVLWVIEELTEKGLIDRSEALEILEKYPTINFRVPVRAIDILKSKFLQ